MKHLSGIFLTIALMLLLPLSALAQLKTPKIIEHPPFQNTTGRMMLDNQKEYDQDKLHSRQTTDQNWKVFTDRSNVSLYDKNNFKTAIKVIPTLGTMGQVMDESKTGVEVVIDLAGVPTTGWLKKSECVVWSNPLVKHDSAVDIKAFIVNLQDTSFIKEVKGDLDLKDFYRIYDSPTSTATGNREPIYQILFAYKYDNLTNRYLLGDNYHLSQSGQLLGWVNANRIKIWDTAIALEPNWNEKSREERKNAGGKFTASVYRTIRDAQDHLNGKSIQHLLTRDPADKSLDEYDDLLHSSGRYYGDVPRFPFMSKTDEIIECGAIGKCTASSIQFGGSNEMAFARLRKQLEKRVENRKNTNIVFVVDGTGNMGKYVQKVLPAAADKITAATDPELRNTLKFGMVVYFEGNCKASPSTLIRKKTELTSDIGLFKKRAYVSYKKDAIVTDFVPMRYALYEALESVGMEEYDNNIVIHIGKTADVSKDMAQMFCDGIINVNESDLILSLKKYRPSIVSIQAEWDSNKDEYLQFVPDNKGLMMNLANAVNKAESEKFVLYGDDESYLVQSVEQEGYLDLSNAPSLMRVYFPDRSLDKDIASPTDIINKIEASYGACLERNDQQIKLLRELFHDNTESGKAIAEYNEVFRQSVQGISPDLLKLLASKRVQLYSTAYTYTRHPNANYPLYRQVLFLRRSSVQTMKELFVTIEDGADNLDTEGMKRVLVNALERYAEALLNITLLEGESIDISEINEKLLGVQDDVLDSKSSVLSGLSSFKEINSLSGDETKLLYNALRKKGRNFNEAVSLNYAFTYHAGVGNVKTNPELEFYWIPVELLL